MHRRIALLLALPLAAVLASACRPATQPATPPASHPLRVSEAWLRTASAGGTTAAYMRIANLGDESDRLVAARCPWAKECRLQETRIVQGLPRLVPLEHGLPLPAGEVVELTPGGSHVMLIGVRRNLLPGDQMPLTLVFGQAAEITLQVVVRQPLESDAPGR